MCVSKRVIACVCLWFMRALQCPHYIFHSVYWYGCSPNATILLHLHHSLYKEGWLCWNILLQFDIRLDIHILFFYVLLIKHLMLVLKYVFSRDALSPKRNKCKELFLQCWYSSAPPVFFSNVNSWILLILFHSSGLNLDYLSSSLR